MGPLLGSVRVGLVWAVWHLPLYFAPGTYQHDRWLWWFLVSLVELPALSVLFTWAYRRAGWLVAAPVLAHALGNAAGELLPDGGRVSDVVQSLTIVAGGALCAGLASVRRRRSVRAAVTSLPADEPFAYVTTTGRRTGRPHRIEIWFASAGSTLYLLAGGGRRSDWVANALADPAVTVEVGGHEWGALARLVEDAEDEVARRLVFDKYQPTYDGDLSGWRESALPVALDLTPTAS